MKRTVVAVALAGAAMALLGALVMRSRALPVEAHLGHHAALAELDRSREDFATLVVTLSSAAANMQAPGDGARVVLERLAGSPIRVRQSLPIQGGGSRQERLRHGIDRYTSSLEAAVELASGLLEQQDAYSRQLAFLRETGPVLVQRMQDIRLDRVAADSFQLIVGTLEYARPGTTAPQQELHRLLVSIGRDLRIDANMPTEITRMRAAVETILSDKPLIASKLDQLATAPIATSIDNLAAAADDLYRETLTAVEQARTLLAIYAVLLLAAGGFVAYRLHDSYRQLNAANAELGGLNQFLEQRVKERTAELEDTLHDLRESQVQLVQAEKMSSLGQLVAGISHEINTPLLYLANNAVLIQERVEGARAFVARLAELFSARADSAERRSEHQAQFVAGLKALRRTLRDDEITEGLDEARDLLRDSIEGLGELTSMAQSLKDFSRLDRAPTAAFDVNAGLDKTLLIARNIIKHKAEVRRCYGEVPEIVCSPSQINQVFLNLITNAAQAIETQGEIVISTSIEDQDHIAIRIADTGCGIPKENLDKIRDPFFTTKDVGSGTGLGLSIVDEIVRSHHGRLLVESELGKGSIFTVVLPITQPDGLAKSRGRATESAPHGEALDFAEAG
jgi:two-component system NtrC family sensor kinase